MFCKFCGEKIEENAIFCSKCGAKLTSEEKTNVVSSEIIDTTNSLNENGKPIKKKSDKILNIIQKVVFGCLIAGIVGITLILGIVLVNVLDIGCVCLFGAFDFTKALTIISIVLMLIGVCGIITKAILCFIFKIETFSRSAIKRILVIVLAVACLGCSIWGFVDCSNNNYNYDSSYDSDSSDYDSSNDSDYSSGSSTTSITRSQAISYAKSSSIVLDKIADLYGLKFYYTPDWGTTTATQDSNGHWKVVIKGTISGYLDDYKTGFVYGKKFTAKVTVYSFGGVSVYVSKY